MVNKKLCPQCGDEKPANIKYFIKNSRYEDNLHPVCRECTKGNELTRQRTKSQTWRETKGKEYLGTNFKAYVYRSAKGHAKTKGIPFSITLEDVPDIPTHCPVFGFLLEMDVGGNSPKAPSLDRVDSTKGYEPDNLQFISWRANYLKRNGTIEEFEQLVAHMRKMSGK
jgi:hypothetical protein